jgi:uncharacterized protein (TIRG00374 family)
MSLLSFPLSDGDTAGAIPDLCSCEVFFPCDEEKNRLVIKAHRKRLWLAGIIGLFIFFYTIKQADLTRLLAHLKHIDPVWGTLVILASAASYLCIAAVLHLLLRGMSFVLPFEASARISLLSATLNYVMAIGGLSGMAAKVYLLAKEKVSPSSTLSISVVHGFLTNTVAVVFIYLGFFFLYSGYKMNTREKEAGIAILLVAFLLTWLTIQTILHESFRKRIWQFSLRTVTTLYRKLHRTLNPEKAQAFFDTFNESMNLLVRGGRKLIAPASFALLDWLTMFLCLKFSFLAVNYPIDDRSLMVGFSVGIFAALFSLTPVSIGIMEGTMAGSFYLLGLDYERALMATLIYRFAYFFLPILVSLFFYKRAFMSSAEEIEPDQNTNEA